jgi:hypothetical protein
MTKLNKRAYKRLKKMIDRGGFLPIWIRPEFTLNGRLIQAGYAEIKKHNWKDKYVIVITKKGIEAFYKFRNLQESTI